MLCVTLGKVKASSDQECIYHGWPFVTDKRRWAWTTYCLTAHVKSAGGQRAVSSLKNMGGEASLMIQCLRIHLAMQGMQVRSLVRELRSHKPHGQKKQNRKQKQYYKLLLGEARPGRGLNRSRASMHGDGIRRDPAALKQVTQSD